MRAKISTVIAHLFKHSLTVGNDYLNVDANILKYDEDKEHLVALLDAEDLSKIDEDIRLIKKVGDCVYICHTETQLPTTLKIKPVETPTTKQPNKIIICGAGATGKTQLTRAILGMPFDEKYMPTIGVDLHVGDKYNLWDCAGQEKYGGLKDGYYIQANKAIIVADANQLDTFKEIQNYHRDLMRVVDNIPITLVITNWNKATDKKLIYRHQTRFSQKYKCECHLVSLDDSTRDKVVDKLIEFCSS
jgi:small GTP-binding protein